MILKFARSKVECSVFRGMMFSAAVETKRVLKAYMRRSHMHDLDEILRKFKVYDSRSRREMLHLFRWPRHSGHGRYRYAGNPEQTCENFERKKDFDFGTWKLTSVVVPGRAITSHKNESKVSQFLPD